MKQPFFERSSTLGFVSGFACVRLVRGSSPANLVGVRATQEAGVRPPSRVADLRRVAPPWTTLLVLALAVLTPAAALPQAAEELDSDRPEAWAMKLFTSVTLPTGLGVPERRGRGQFTLGLEGGLVPPLSDEERRVGFNGTKLEDTNKTRVLGRLRAEVGLSKTTSLELGYVPPVSRNGATPHLLSLAVGRPFDLGARFTLGLRAYGQVGTLKGDITCSAAEAAAGADPEQNPFLCEAPSEDELSQGLLGLEVTTGYGRSGRFRPYVGMALTYMDLDFQVNARYSGIVDQTKQHWSGATVSFVGGLRYVPSPHWGLGMELFYSPLPILRPPYTSSANEGLFNVRGFVAYRF
jgi:opacity protein-like surface antigen